MKPENERKQAMIWRYLWDFGASKILKKKLKRLPIFVI